MLSVPRLMTMDWRKEGLNGLPQGASAELPIMDRAAEPPRIGLGSCRRRLLVARIQRNSEEMHASILLLPIFAGVTGDTEVLADKLGRPQTGHAANHRRTKGKTPSLRGGGPVIRLHCGRCSNHDGSCQTVGISRAGKQTNLRFRIIGCSGRLSPNTSSKY